MCIGILKLLYIVKLFSICIDYTSSYESTYLLSLSKALKIEIFFLIFVNLIADNILTCILYY